MLSRSRSFELLGCSHTELQHTCSHSQNGKPYSSRDQLCKLLQLGYCIAENNTLPTQHPHIFRMTAKQVVMAMPDGRYLDVATREGSDKFLVSHGASLLVGSEDDGMQTPTVVSVYASLEQAKGLQKKKEYWKWLSNKYYLIWIVTHKCSTEAFQEHASNETTLTAFVHHFNHVVQAMAKKKTWRKTGKSAEDYFPFLLDCVYTLCIHASFVKAFLAAGGDRSIVTLCESAPRNGINTGSSKCIIGICRNLLRSLTIDNDNFDTDAAFLKLEESGFLFQALSCFRYWDGSKGETPSHFIDLFRLLHTSIVFNLSEKCKKGKPLGDLLVQLLNRPLPPVIADEVQKIVATVNLMSAEDASDKAAEMFVFCNYCKVSESDLEELGEYISLCTACNRTGYCSRKCQVRMLFYLEQLSLLVPIRVLSRDERLPYYCILCTMCFRLNR